MAARALIHLPPTIRRGEIVEVRAHLAHPMETGFRPDGQGRVLPRDIVRRVEARLDGAFVFAADLHPAIAANPYLAFPLKAERSGTLVIAWRGDNGFAHSESVAFTVAA